MRWTNKLNLPAPLARAIMFDDYDDGGADITVTRLIAPPQQVALLKRHADERCEDVSDHLWSTRGRLHHVLLERGADGDPETLLAEERLNERVMLTAERTWTLSGQVDHLSVDGILTDYKDTSVWSIIDGPKPEWEAQLNVLRWLCWANDHEVRALQIVATLRDWSQNKARQGGTYPPHGVAVLPVRMWALETTGQYIRERVAQHYQAQTTGELPPCTDVERWVRPTQWAVMKRGAVKATKLHDTVADAEGDAARRGPGYTVVERPGEAVRCAQYCAAAPWCQQGASA